jgi:bifunctional oligoribonuclease and PAP phosphatase NrnA
MVSSLTPCATCIIKDYTCNQQILPAEQVRTKSINGKLHDSSLRRLLSTSFEINLAHKPERSASFTLFSQCCATACILNRSEATHRASWSLATVIQSQKISPAKQSGPVQLSCVGESDDATFAAQIKSLLKPGMRVGITGHEKPDGDCIGSEVALCSLLREQGFSAEIFNSDPCPERFDFINCEKMVHQPKLDEVLKVDVMFVLDATDLRRLGKIKREQFGAAIVVNIDHHLANPNFGTINWVDTRAAATGELIYRLAAFNKWKMPPVGLVALYTALVTDTGQFSYSNTSPRVLRMAAELIEFGVDPEVIWQKVFLNKSHAELALESLARASLLTAAGGRICSIALSQDDFAATGTGPQHTEEFASIPRSMTGVELALFFYEVDGGKKTKVSFRSTRNLSACDLAQKFGGGGHKQAAGCTINARVKEAIAQVMPVAEKFVAEA